MKYNDNGTIKDIVIKAGDTLPVGTIVEFDGDTIPSGWELVDDTGTYKKIKKNYNGVVPNGKVLNSNSSSLTDTYSCDYINKNYDTKVYTGYFNGNNLLVKNYDAIKQGNLVSLNINLRNETGSSVSGTFIFGISSELKPKKTLFVPIIRSGGVSYCSINTDGYITLATELFNNTEEISLHVTYSIE